MKRGGSAPQDGAPVVARLGVKKTKKRKSVRWRESDASASGTAMPVGASPAPTREDEPDIREDPVMRVPLPEAPNGALLDLLEDMNQAIADQSAKSLSDDASKSNSEASSSRSRGDAKSSTALNLVHINGPHDSIRNLKFQAFWRDCLSPLQVVRFPLFMVRLLRYLASPKVGLSSAQITSLVGDYAPGDARDAVLSGGRGRLRYDRFGNVLEDGMRAFLGLGLGSHAVTAVRLDRALSGIPSFQDLHGVLQVVRRANGMNTLPPSTALVVKSSQATSKAVTKHAGQVLVYSDNHDIPDGDGSSGSSCSRHPLPICIASEAQKYMWTVVHGASGAGKTMAVLEAAHNLRCEGLGDTSLWVDCRAVQSKYGLLSRLAWSLGLRGATVQQLEMFVGRFIATLSSRCLLVLDHVVAATAKIIASLFQEYASPQPSPGIDDDNDGDNDHGGVGEGHDHVRGFRVIVVTTDGEAATRELSRVNNTDHVANIHIGGIARDTGSLVVSRFLAEQGTVDKDIHASILNAVEAQVQAEAQTAPSSAASTGTTGVPVEKYVTMARLALLKPPILPTLSEPRTMVNVAWAALGADGRALARLLSPMEQATAVDSADDNSYQSPGFDLGIALMLVDESMEFGDLKRQDNVTPARAEEGADNATSEGFTAVLALLHPLARQEHEDDDDDENDGGMARALRRFVRAWQRLRAVGWVRPCSAGDSSTVGARWDDLYFLAYRVSDVDRDADADADASAIRKSAAFATPEADAGMVESASVRRIQKRWDRMLMVFARLTRLVDGVLLSGGAMSDKPVVVATREDDSAISAQAQGPAGLRDMVVDGADFDVAREGVHRAALDLLDRNRPLFDILLGLLADVGQGQGKSKRKKQRGTDAAGILASPDPSSPPPSALKSPLIQTMVVSGSVLSRDQLVSPASTLAGHFLSVCRARYTTNQGLPIVKGIYEALGGNASATSTTALRMRALSDYSCGLLRVGRLPRAEEICRRALSGTQALSLGTGDGVVGLEVLCTARLVDVLWLHASSEEDAEKVVGYLIEARLLCEQSIFALEIQTLDEGRSDGSSGTVTIAEGHTGGKTDGATRTRDGGGAGWDALTDPRCTVADIHIRLSGVLQALARHAPYVPAAAAAIGEIPHHADAATELMARAKSALEDSTRAARRRYGGGEGGAKEADALTHLGLVLLHMDAVEPALQAFSMGVRLYASAYGDATVAMGRAVSGVAACLYRLDAQRHDVDFWTTIQRTDVERDFCAEAVQYYQEALVLYEGVLPGRHRVITDSRMDLARVLTDMSTVESLSEATYFRGVALYEGVIEELCMRLRVSRPANLRVLTSHQVVLGLLQQVISPSHMNDLLENIPPSPASASSFATSAHVRALGGSTGARAACRRTFNAVAQCCEELASLHTKGGRFQEAVAMYEVTLSIYRRQRTWMAPVDIADTTSFVQPQSPGGNAERAEQMMVAAEKRARALAQVLPRSEKEEEEKKRKREKEERKDGKRPDDEAALKTAKVNEALEGDATYYETKESVTDGEPKNADAPSSEPVPVGTATDHEKLETDGGPFSSSSSPSPSPAPSGPTQSDVQQKEGAAAPPPARGSRQESAQDLKIAQVLLGLAQQYANLGASLRDFNLAGKREALVKALGAAREAMELFRSIYRSDDHPCVLLCLQSIAAVHAEQGKRRTAVHVYDKIITLYRKAEYAEPVELANVLSAKAEVLRSGTDQDLLEAQALLQQAHGLYDQTLGPRHMDTATAQLGVAMTHYELEEFEEALPHFTACLDVFREVAGSHTGGLGLRFHMDRRHDRSAGSDVDGRSSAPSDAVAHIPEILTCLGSMRHHKKDVRGARQLYTEALRQYMNLHGEKHPNVAKVLNNLAALMDDAGETADAQELYEHALYVLQAYYGRSHVSVAVAMENLANLLLVSQADNEDAVAEANSLMASAEEIRDDVEEGAMMDVHPTEEEEVAPADDFLLDVVHGAGDTIGLGSAGADSDILEGGGCVVM